MVERLPVREFLDQYERGKGGQVLADRFSAEIAIAVRDDLDKLQGLPVPPYSPEERRAAAAVLDQAGGEIAAASSEERDALIEQWCQDAVNLLVGTRRRLLRSLDPERTPAMRLSQAAIAAEAEDPSVIKLTPAMRRDRPASTAPVTPVRIGPGLDPDTGRFREGSMIVGPDDLPSDGT